MLSLGILLQQLNIKKMKKLFITILLFLTIFLGSSILVEARTVRVKSYFRSNGTYVQSYYRTSPNRSKLDNWSTSGNYNPYTGRKGYKNLW